MVQPDGIIRRQVGNQRVGGKDAHGFRLLLHCSQKMLAIIGLDGGSRLGLASPRERGIGSGGRPPGSPPNQRYPH